MGESPPNESEIKNIIKNNDNSNTIIINNSVKKGGNFRKSQGNNQFNSKIYKKESSSKISPNILNQKYSNSNRNEIKIKSNDFNINKFDSRTPWGWGGNTTKNNVTKKISYEIDIKNIDKEEGCDNIINNNMSKSQKKAKDNINNEEKKLRNVEINNLQRKRGMSSYSAFSTTNKNKEEQSNANYNNKI